MNGGREPGLGDSIGTNFTMAEQPLIVDQAVPVSSLETYGPVEKFHKSTDSIRSIIENMQDGPGKLEALEALRLHEEETARVIERLDFEATHDYLTKLYNRRAFLDIVSEHLINVYESGELAGRSPGSLVFMDLNGFGQLNDDLGHMVADQVLIQFSSVAENLRDSDVAARLGGDEFVIFLPDSNPELVAKAVARRTATILRENPIVIDGKAMDITFAAGSMALPASVDIPQGIDQKEFYIELVNRFLTEAGLREKEAKKATGHNQIAVSYPDSKTGEDVVLSQEELLRWQRPDREEVEPGRQRETDQLVVDNV